MQKIYTTNLIPHVAILTLHGIEIDSVEKRSGIVFYSFKNSLRVQGLIEMFDDNELSVDPKLYYEHIQHAKKHFPMRIIKA